MQLLQVLRDSNYIDTLIERIQELEKRAKDLSLKIVDFLKNASGDVILYSYTGLGYTPASILYWSHLIFQANKQSIIAECEEASIHILPYRENIAALIFSTGEYSKLIQALQVARILGTPYYAMAPLPPSENLKLVLKHLGVETTPFEDLIEAALYMTIASFTAISELYKDKLGVRGRRLHDHGREGFAVTVKEFIEKYSSILEVFLKAQPIKITSTRFLEAPTLLLVRALRELKINATYIPLEDVSTSDNVLGIFLTAEERIKKELRTKLRERLIELTFNLDPLEVIVYLAVLSYVLYNAKVVTFTQNGKQEGKK
jgi:hypothetical protein